MTHSKLETRNSKLDSLIPLAQPDLSDLEREYVNDVLTSSRLSMGPWRDRFEEKMASLCGVEHAVAVSSGTAALHLIVRGLDIGPGDEVITTPFSFVASSNCILYEQATPRFVDIDPNTLALDLSHVEQACTERTRAILAVDVFGQPAPWPELEDLAKRLDLLLIDDACEAPGASVAGRPIGSWGRAAAFGFYPNKQLTTGEGGCIVTNDADPGRRLPFDGQSGPCVSIKNGARAAGIQLSYGRTLRRPGLRSIRAPARPVESPPTGGRMVYRCIVRPRR